MKTVRHYRVRPHEIDAERVYTLTQAERASRLAAGTLARAIRAGALACLPPLAGKCRRPSMRPPRRIAGAELLRWLAARKGGTP